MNSILAKLSSQSLVARQHLVGLLVAAIVCSGFAAYVLSGRTLLVLAVLAAIPPFLLFVRYPFIAILLTVFAWLAGLSGLIPRSQELLLYGTAFAALLHKVLRGDLTWRVPPYLFWFSMLFVWTATSIVWAPGQPRMVFFLLRTSAEAVIFSWLLCEFVATPRHFRWLVFVLGCGIVFTAASAVYGTYLFFTTKLDPANPQTLETIKHARFYGHWGGANALSHTVMPFVPLLVPFLRRAESRLVRSGAAFALLCGLLAVGMTLTRAANIALLLALLICVVALEHRRVIAVLAGTVVVTTLLLLPVDALERLSEFTKGKADASISERTQVVKASFEGGLEAFPFGGGAGSFNVLIQDYMLHSTDVHHAHNTFAHIFMETGLIGITLLLITLAVVVRTIFHRPAWERRATFQRSVRIALLAAVVGAMFALFFEHLLHWSPTWMLFSLAAIYPHVFAPASPSGTDTAARPV